MGTGRGSTEAFVAAAARDAAAPADEVGAESKRAPVPPAPSVAPYASLGHEALFEHDSPRLAEHCDVCGELVADDEGAGPAVPGRALYVWTRGDEVRREEPPLCPSCAAALGLSALARWEIEEEEG